VADDLTIGTVAVTEDELNRDPDGVLRMATVESRVAICQGGVPVAYMISGDEWMKHVRHLADAGIIVRVARQEQGEDEEPLGQA